MKLLLATLHAKYSHASLALPYLAAVCRDIAGVNIVLREWTINEPREHTLRQAIAEKADLIAFSCYIWNIEKTLHIASDIKKISPATLIILGGPEVSFGMFELMHEHPFVDGIIRGEGEDTFRKLVLTLLRYGGSYTGQNLMDVDNLVFRDGNDIVAGRHSKRRASLDTIPSPFSGGLVDLKKPLVYYETARGCPFSCAYCLSSTEGSVRSFGRSRIHADLLFLMQRGVRNIKLVDRTFNYDAVRAGELWDFILQNNRTSHFHFEIAADLLTEENLTILERVPEQTFRFEIGVQSTSAETLERVGRQSNLPQLFENVRKLRERTAVELHLDLIAGLPGEDYEGFLHSLHTVIELGAHEIQIEPLKVLKGSPMRDIAERDDYYFSQFPPYAILRNPWLEFEDVCRIETIARLLDLFLNHGHFSHALQVLSRQQGLAAILDAMARQVGNDNLSSLSLRSTFELFARLAAHFFDEPGNVLLRDALLYDYCLREMPLLGKLPTFAIDHHQLCTWPGTRDIQQHLGELPANSRVKVFRSTFQRDYRHAPWTESPTTISFVYLSGPGRGLQVKVI